MLQSTTQSFASTLLASGRSEAQHEELANLRTANQTYNNDVRLNNIRLAADGASAEKMGLLQFASTLMSTAKPKQVEAEGVPAAAPFDAMAAMRAMCGGPSSGPSPALLGYGGEEGAEQWAEKERARGKAKKRKKKEKRERQKGTKEAKIRKLVDKGMTYQAAAAVVTDVMDSDSSSSSSSS